MSRERLVEWRDRRAGQPLTFTLDGATYLVPQRPARTWVLALLSDDPTDLLLDLLDPDDADQLWADTIDPGCDLTTDLLHTIGRELLGRAAGRPWWQVTRLVAELVGRWAEWDAHCTDRGLGDPLDWPLERLCNWAYARAVAGMTPEQRRQLEAELAAPLGEPEDTGGDAEADWDDGSSWLAMAGQFGAAAEGSVGRAS